jgi:hypothetical protein
VFPNFTMNDTTELMDNWENFEEPILEIDFEENVVADEGRLQSHSSLFQLNPQIFQKSLLAHLSENSTFKGTVA